MARYVNRQASNLNNNISNKEEVAETVHSLNTIKTVKKGTSNRIYAIATDASSSATNESMPRKVEVVNEGRCPITILTGYETYSDETTGAGAKRYLQTLLMPNESFAPPVRSVISTEAASTQFDGTASNSGVYTKPAISSNLMYVDSGVNLGAKIEDTDTTITTEANGTNAFRVGDLIQIGNVNTEDDDQALEIMRVTEITSATVMQVDRTLHGSADTVDGDQQNHATHGAVSGANINFPYFNAFHDCSKYTSSKTDSNGKFKVSNMFGLGRSKTATDNVGIVAGSFALRFYKAGYQSLGLSGIKSSTETGLTAGSTYYLKVSCDGSTALEINVTIDSSNTQFGGTNGLISKLQTALDAQFYTAGHLFEKQVNVGIVDGDLRFTSGQRGSDSAIALSAGTSGADASVRFFAQANGRIPALANLNTAVPADVPDEYIYDPITYEKSRNEEDLAYDDGRGNILGAAVGKINYETGAFEIHGAPIDADFQYLVNHSSALSGKVSSDTTGRINSLQEILANTISQKEGKVRVKVS
tara:strand:- start:403 stop:1995 length:1593 start_codon:yes stop_codon:yes gene_type:complete